MKRAILVHGWDGSPDRNWFPWLKKQLKNRGFEVIAPQLPDPLTPKIKTWVPALAQAVGPEVLDGGNGGTDPVGTGGNRAALS